MRTALLTLLVVVPALAGCSTPPPASPPGPPPPTPPPQAGFNPIVRLGTDLGDVYIEVFDEMAPLTAAAFLGFARSGFYDGTRMHGIVKSPSSILMGDPATRDPTRPRETWGHGDPNLPKLPPEHHPLLRHDKAGVVSMVSDTPDNGTSMFRITLARAGRFDDQATVFGQVVAGMEVVDAMSKVRRVGETPVEDVTVRATEVIPAQRDPSQVTHGLRAWNWGLVWNTTANSTAQVAAAVTNTGNVGEAVNATLQLPPGWAGQDFFPRNFRELGNLSVPAGTSQLWMFLVHVPADAKFGAHPANVTFTGASGVTSSTVVTLKVGTLGRAPKEGDAVLVNYLGALTDGRMFEASYFSVAANEAIPRVASFPPLRSPDQYPPLPFTIGSEDLIQGFSIAARNLREGEARVFPMGPDIAYPAWAVLQDGRPSPLAGRFLGFVVEFVGFQP